jgi:cysteine-rich repeat protein
MASARVAVLQTILVLAAACSGTSDITIDAGTDAAPPPGWTCDPRGYGDGVVCHCECGVTDPDCASGDRIVSGCTNNQVCSAAGTCTDCGDGQLDAGEQCDVAQGAMAECGPLGYEPGQVPCTETCTWAYDRCEPLATCGNGMLDANELCDGTHVKAGLDCTDYGKASGSLACGTACQIVTSGCYTCGDGSISGPETCDDHGASGGDGCSATCMVETGWQCAGQPSLCTPVCGDGIRVGGEACDDGNTNSNDGCSASCKVEQDCTCTGTPSICSCATLQVITTTTQRIDTASLALDGAGQPHVVYYYGVHFTDPVTNYSMEHAHVVYATRPTTSWTTTEIYGWDQTQTVVGPDDLVLAYDGGTLRAYMHRIYNTGKTFTVGTRGSNGWQFAHAGPYYNYDVIRGGGAWHALVAGSGLGDFRYYMGAPGAWTRDEPLTGINSNYPARLAHATSGDVYIASINRPSNNTSYNLKLHKRVDATTWSTIYDVQRTGTCVFPVMHQPLALAGGEVVAFEDGFSGSTQRWLRAHRKSGASWVVEDVADLSWLNKSCSSGSASYSLLRMVSAVDHLGQPHILYASQPVLSSPTLEDHYRDATGWKVRKYPLSSATPLDMEIDGNGTTHLLALAPGSTQGTTRLVYIRISANAWQAAP